jgi:ribosomal protein L37AE/L43A
MAQPPCDKEINVNGLCKWNQSSWIRGRYHDSTGRRGRVYCTEGIRTKKRIEEEKHKKFALAKKTSLKELHFMRCPKCGMELIQIEYKGIKIDECSECRGIWLDAGELSTVSKLEKGVLDKLFSVFQSS